MTGVRVEYDHVSLTGSHPRNIRRVPAAPREGETVSILGKTFVVYRVHWWEQPVRQGTPDARLVLRTAEEYALIRARDVDRPAG